MCESHPFLAEEIGWKNCLEDVNFKKQRNTRRETWEAGKEERYAIMETRKHYTNYFRGLTHFKPYRSRLVTIENPAEVLSTLNEIEQEYISKYGNVQELGDLNNLQYGKTEEKQIIV